LKCLVVKLGAFGDIIHCLPALDDLLQRAEVDELHWLVDARYAFVTDVFPQQVHVHRIDLKGPRPWHSTWRTIRHLCRLRFDAVIDLQGLIKSGLLARAVHANTYGFDRHFSPEQGNHWLVQPVSFHAGERHVVQQYRRIASGPFTADAAHRPDAPLPYVPPRVEPAPAMHTAFAREKKMIPLDDHPFVVLHLGGGWETKQLPQGKWQALIKGVLEHGCLPLLSWGSARERHLAQVLANGSGAIALPRRLPMPALCGMLAQARAVIGTDTGIIHLAAALGTPTATFWGPSASWRSGPLHNSHVHAESAPACGPCFKRTCNHFTCMDDVRIKELLEVLCDSRR